MIQSKYVRPSKCRQEKSQFINSNELGRLMERMNYQFKKDYVCDVYEKFARAKSNETRGLSNPSTNIGTSYLENS
jgi:hypothetical protein